MRTPSQESSALSQAENALYGGSDGRTVNKAERERGAAELGKGRRFFKRTLKLADFGLVPSLRDASAALCCALRLLCMAASSSRPLGRVHHPQRWSADSRGDALPPFFVGAFFCTFLVPICSRPEGRDPTWPRLLEKIGKKDFRSPKEKLPFRETTQAPEMLAGEGYGFTADAWNAKGTSESFWSSRQLLVRKRGGGGVPCLLRNYHHHRPTCDGEEVGCR